MRLLSVLLLLVAAPACLAHDTDEKRPLDHSDYERWNSIGQRLLSPDGQWVMYSIQDGKSRSTLFIRHATSAREFKIPFASSGRFTSDSSRAIFTVSPNPELVKKLTKEKKKSAIPKSRVVVMTLESGHEWTMTDVQRFRLAEDNADWIAILLKKADAPDTTQDSTSSINEVYEVTESGLKKSSGKSAKKSGEISKPESKDETKKEPAAKKDKRDGATLVLRNLNSGREQRFPFVTDFEFTEDGKRLACTTSCKADGQQDGVLVIDVEDGESTRIVSGRGDYSRLSFNKDGSKLAFLSNRDDYAADKPLMSLYLLTGWSKKAEQIAFKGDGIPKDWSISSGGTPTFSENNRRLFFSTRPIPKKEDKDEAGEPKAKLDLWHWKDPVLQPEQLLRAERERNRSYRALYDLSSRKVIQLATVDLPTVSPDPRCPADVALGVSDQKYKVSQSWDRPGFNDFYLVDLKTGKHTEIAAKVRGTARLSPNGKFVGWWDADKLAYFAMSTETKDIVQVSKGIKFKLYDELHDTPNAPYPYGTAAWLDNDRAMLVYDRFDIWQLDPRGKQKPKCVTKSVGRENSIRFRYERLDSEKRTINPEDKLLLSAFDEESKASGYYSLTLADDADAPEKLIMLDERVGSVLRAKDADSIVFSRSTFRMPPDVWFSSTDFKQVRRISRSNPQQHEYTWGTAELVHWDSADKVPLSGILYKPDGFDASKKYPLMVYFYERNSDNLHRYWRPEAGRSIINFSFYVSRGYVLFVPDIPYTDGFPGDSAAKAVIPGVESILEYGYIDKKRVGMQGHSWGGYQTAYLVTKTDMFACAESGAPVSNMTSAYGGIRWGSGMSRMFQYERTQSRIGKTLWEGRDLYIQNSPLFHADKINTPLLILHNDEDGAVPWYQGIELFVALRRLSKPAWLMNYNGEPHWVMKKENRLDFAKRMQQFFDHYLKGDPMPEWMATGIPAVDKGRKFGFDPAKKADKPADE